MKTITRFLRKYPKVQSILRVMLSFLPWNSTKKVPRKKGLQIKVQRQWTNYSCCAAVAQMVAQYYGIRLGHRKAIQLTKCKPNGTTLEKVGKVLSREYGLVARSLRTKNQIRRSLQQEYPVMTNDSLTYVEDHAILLVGETPKGFWIADPATCSLYWRHEDRVMAGADEFIAVEGERAIAN